MSPVPQNTINNNVLTVGTALTVQEDLRYTAVVSFSNLAGEFNMTSEINFSKLIENMYKIHVAIIFNI